VVLEELVVLILVLYTEAEAVGLVVELLVLAVVELAVLVPLRMKVMAEML
jgi:hypothetical protein